MKAITYNHIIKRASLKNKSFVDYTGTLTILLLLIANLNLWSQTQKKRPLTVSDYNRWGTMHQHKVSEEGHWVSFLMQYDESPDTLLVKQVHGKKTFRLLNTTDGKFWNEDKFAFLDRSNLLHVIDLDSGFENTIENVKDFSISKNGKYLITGELKKGIQHLVIRNLEGRELERIEGLQYYKMNNLKDALVSIISKNGSNMVLLMNLGVKIGKILITESDDLKFSKPVWSNSDNSIAFFKVTLDEISVGINHYELKNNKLSYFMPSKFDNVINDYSLSDVNNTLFISPDNERVFFMITKKTDPDTKANSVQIWHTNDAEIYPQKKVVENFVSNTKVMTWNPESNKLTSITDKASPYCLINPTRDFALTYNTQDLGAQYKMNPNVNYFLKNLKTNESEMFLENQITTSRWSALSPGGRYFAYIKDKDWWVYDFKKKVKFIVASEALIQTINKDDPWETTYGVAGWGLNDKYLLLYDKYDIWKIPFDGIKPVRLTKGREKKVVYRIPRLKQEKYAEFYDVVDQVIDIKGEILLSANGENQTGYFMLQPNGQLKKIIFDDYFYGNIVRSSKSNNYVFQYRRYDSPPGLIYYNVQRDSLNPFYQSNKHHYEYLWGKQEIIHYKNSKGVPLKGILNYPADYNPDKKYPLVVSIYEDQNYLKNYYINPTVYNPAGLNVTTLNAQGYFVLLPDIVYEVGHPGISATDCVVAATNKVISTGLILKDKIALMGQSFGGYETNFIITQTDLFKTAISSASVFDLTSFYLSISQNSNVPEHWRFENQQWRMGNSLFADRDKYNDNSPLTWVEQIHTPVLIWTGENDTQINPNQSYAMYLALRRLNKKAIMLVYPEESHSLIYKENQKDLYFKIQEWLAYFLKDKTEVNWVHKGMK
ncbi:alpha/beta hydrolase family protein [Winogradskyella sp.]|uniref:alpha/beta hydrolase family protein n=1 Tax=Winogradskyella sp. TaxID=1883156 RepID=UPI003AB6AA3B